jgi:NADPH:quinone reductase
MKALMMTKVGEPEVLQLQQVDEPVIRQPSEVKIKLFAAGVNPIDTKIRRGGLLQGDRFPVILGCDGAGEVVEVGASVSRYKLGDKVWFCHGGLGLEQGNYAPFNVIDERWLASMPSNASYIEAAAAPLVLITAWGALYNRGRLQAGQTVLIHGGAGGVGHVAIQLAKLRGARVITTVSSPEKEQFVRTLGADEVIIYPIEDTLERLLAMTLGRGADLVFDTVGRDVFLPSITMTAHFGTLVSILDPGVFDFQEARMRNLSIAFELMLTPMLRNLSEARDEQVAILQRCAEYMLAGQLVIEVSEVFSLAEGLGAHAIIEAGHTQGKIVLTI